MNRKKYLKLFPLMLLTVFLLSGCVSLQDLKDEHAVYKDSTKKTVIWQGNEYVYLMNNEELFFYVDSDPEISLYVTASDVPTLLKYRLGDFAYVSKDKNLLNVYSDVYCLKEKYEELSARIKEDPDMDIYACEYQTFGEDEVEGGITLLHTFTKDEGKLLEKIEKNSIQKKIKDDVWYSAVSVGSMYYVSEDGLFREYRDVGLYRTAKGEYFWEKFEVEDYKTYMIPEEYKADIEMLFADEIKEADLFAE